MPFRLSAIQMLRKSSATQWTNEKMTFISKVNNSDAFNSKNLGACLPFACYSSKRYSSVKSTWGHFLGSTKLHKDNVMSSPVFH